MTLLVDIGNLRMKWAWQAEIMSLAEETRELDGSGHKTTVPTRQNTLEYGDTGLSAGLDATLRDVPEQVLVSSVASSDICRQLSDHCRQRWGLEPEFARSGESFSGLVNGYDDPATLGVDRWLALVGARYLFPQNAVVVVDAGTAVTVDYASAQGLYRGGIIFPGIRTMLASLNTSTGQIRVATEYQSDQAVELQNPDTRAAVTNGVLHTCASSVRSAVERFRQTGENLAVIVCGGDGPLLARLAGVNCLQYPDLVLVGLAQFADETAL